MPEMTTQEICDNLVVAYLKEVDYFDNFRKYEKEKTALADKILKNVDNLNPIKVFVTSDNCYVVLVHHNQDVRILRIENK